MTRSTICLAMMVHNEAHLLQRIWNSIGHRIDAAVLIIRPEYEDDSYEVAQRLFGHLPGKIECLPDPVTPHRGFDTSRQELTDRAREYNCDYVLWTDPDNPFIGRIPDRLTEDYYELEHHGMGSNYDMNWWMTHLVKSTAKLEWMGRVHELIDVFNPPQELHKITSCYIDHSVYTGDAQRATDLYIPLLLADMADNPLDSRQAFNLARSYALAGDDGNAIEWYSKRLSMKGFTEETYLSLYQIGLLNMKHENFKEAELWLMRAFCYRPTRREAYRMLISLMGKVGAIEFAEELFGHYQNILPSEDIIMVEDGPR